MILYSGFALTKSSPLPELRTNSCYCPQLVHPAAPKKKPQRGFFGHSDLGTAPVIVLEGLGAALVSLSVFPHGTALLCWRQICAGNWILGVKKEMRVFWSFELPLRPKLFVLCKALRLEQAKQ